MQNLQHTYDEIFSEIKLLLEDLSNSDSHENLLSKENTLNELYQKFSFLKISNDLEFMSTEPKPVESIDNQPIKGSYDLSVEEVDNENRVAEQPEMHDIFDKVPEVEGVHSFKEIDQQEHSQENVEEEVSAFSEVENEENLFEDEILSEETQATEDDLEENELVEEVSDFAKIDSDNNQVEEEIEAHNNELEELEDNLFQDSSQKLEPMQDSQFSFAMDREEILGPKEDDYETRLAEKEARLKELEENRRKIIEFSKENTAAQEKPKQEYESAHDDQHDKKFKLANIKGLKIAKSLFDDDHLEDLEQSKPKQESGSLLKNNVPTDYMEAPKPKPEFKLDLNDRIAFSQHLFNGSQSELNQVVTVLNSFTSLDKAQEFLSDIYYERDWKKVDNYAQRLWTLVENRFL